LPAIALPRQPPSGDQFEIGHGRHRVVVTEVGATLRSYTFDGVPVVDGFELQHMCDSGRGQVLAPWPNRLADGTYRFEGRDAGAPLDEPERGNAIHGLVRWIPWQMVSRAQNVVTLRCSLNPQPGYPWRLSLDIEYRLGRSGLSVSLRSTNLDEVVAPFGVGFHPYVTVGAPSVDTTSLVVPARRRLVTDERGLPISSQAVAGSEFDFTSRRWLGPTCLDTAFTDFVRDRDGMTRIELDESTGRRGLIVWMDQQFRYAMLYTGDAIEASDRRRQSIAVEPMSCPPNALRSGVDIVRLDPGASWLGRWGLSPR
jgi:galactose mutarotase-like enzyme